MAAGTSWVVPMIGGLAAAAALWLFRPPRAPLHLRGRQRTNVAGRLDRTRFDRGRLAQGLRMPGSSMGQGAGQFDGEAMARLAERVAALSRAGLATRRIWGLLAEVSPKDEVDPATSAIAAAATTVSQVLEEGGTQADGLRRAGGVVGPAGWLALACDVSQVSGAGLAEVLDGIAGSLRAEIEAAREREGALAGPRATAAVLTWLPLAGVGLGLLTGADSLRVLLTTTPGLACLVLSASLWGAGRWWMAHLLRRAERIGQTVTAGPP